MSRRPKTPGIDAWKKAMDEFRAKEKEEIEYGFSLPPEYQPEGGRAIIPEGGPAVVLGLPSYSTLWGSVDSDPGMDIKAFMAAYKKSGGLIIPAGAEYDYREEYITLDDGKSVHNCDTPNIGEYALEYPLSHWTCPVCRQKWLRGHDQHYWTAHEGVARTSHRSMDNSELEKPKSIFDEIGDFSDTA